jgi:hypothetical protein
MISLFLCVVIPPQHITAEYPHLKKPGCWKREPRQFAESDDKPQPIANTIEQAVKKDRDKEASS